MNLNHLRIFFLCGQHQTFSKAAESLPLTLPAVTMQIKQLEAYFGIQLFHRHAKAIELTECGRLLFEYAQKIFELDESAEKTIADHKNLKKGNLRVGTLQIYARFMMPPLIAAFQERYPSVHVVVDEGSSKEVIQSLINNNNELGLITIGPLAYPQLEIIPLFEEELALILANNHPLNRKRKICLEDLADESLIIQQKGAVSRELILDKYREVGIEPHILTEARNLAFIIELVQAGKGIAFIARSALKDYLERRSLKSRSLAEGPFLIHINMAFLKNRILSPAACAFKDLLIERKNERNLGKSTTPPGILKTT